MVWGVTIPKNTYLIDIELPSKVKVPDLSVTEIDNPQNEKGEKVDSFGFLIGMDIISMGDSAITNYEGRTIMTFRIPSLLKIDFVEEWNRRKAVENRHRGKAR